jgi:hypothetical protein
VNPEQPPQKLTVKMLRDAGATKLAEAAEDTINRLREIGAPDFSEDRVIRTILKEAAKSQGTKVDLANRNPKTPGPALRFLKWTLFCVVTTVISISVAVIGGNLLETVNAPGWLTNLFVVGFVSLALGIIAYWIRSIWRILLPPP